VQGGADLIIVTYYWNLHLRVRYRSLSWLVIPCESENAAPAK
jgi:hypothetical protein